MSAPRASTPTPTPAPTTPRSATYPSAVAPAAPADYVPGTTIDESLAAAIAAQLPSLPAPDDVYPSDSHTAGPIPDADFAAAEDWQATYTENGNEVLLITGLPSEGTNNCGGCPSQHGPRRHAATQPYSSIGDDGRTRWYFGTYFTRDDGTFANAWEIVDRGRPRRSRGPAARDRRRPRRAGAGPRAAFAALGATAPCSPSAAGSSGR